MLHPSHQAAFRPGSLFRMPGLVPAPTRPIRGLRTWSAPAQGCQYHLCCHSLVPSPCEGKYFGSKATAQLHLSWTKPCISWFLSLSLVFARMCQMQRALRGFVLWLTSLDAAPHMSRNMALDQKRLDSRVWPFISEDQFTDLLPLKGFSLFVCFLSLSTGCVP